MILTQVSQLFWDVFDNEYFAKCYLAATLTGLGLSLINKYGTKGVFDLNRLSSQRD